MVKWKLKSNNERIDEELKQKEEKKKHANERTNRMWNVEYRISTIVKYKMYNKTYK